jgi:hypothetical protein
MYWYLKNLHNETFSRSNLGEILRNIAKFCKRKYNKISSLFCISRNKKILYRDHPTYTPLKG